MRTAGWFAVVALLAATALVYRHCSRGSTEPAAGPGAAVSDAERERVAAFWNAYRSGQALARQGQWQQAVEALRSALASEPRHEGALYDLANCFFELGLYHDALDTLQRLVQVAPKSQRGHRQIGLVHSCPGAGDLFDLAAAEAALLRAFDINPEETGCLLALAGIALVQGREQRAIEMYALANRSNPRAVEGFYLRAYLRTKQGRAEEARELLAAAVRASAQPQTVAGVPGEGETRAGDRLPPTTLEDKRLLRPFWNGLAARFPEARADDRDLDIEFEPLETWLTELRRR